LVFLVLFKPICRWFTGNYGLFNSSGGVFPKILGEFFSEMTSLPKSE